MNLFLMEDSLFRQGLPKKKHEKIFRLRFITNDITIDNSYLISTSNMVRFTVAVFALFAVASTSARLSGSVRH